MSKPLTKTEATVLEILNDRFSDENGNCLPSGFIAALADLSLLQARRAVKSLQRRGHAELVRGIFRDDGMLAGSGYCCTRAGRDAFEAMMKPASPLASDQRGTE